MYLIRGCKAVPPGCPHVTTAYQRYFAALVKSGHLDGEKGLVFPSGAYARRDII
jgi:hypothetical protein